MKIRATFTLFIGSCICALTFAAGQRIESSPVKWLSYEIHSAGLIIFIKVPPGHRFKEDPHVISQPFDPGRPLIKQIFTAQYDYGWRRWANVAQFEVTYTLIRLSDSVGLDTPLPEFRAALNKAVQNGMGRPGGAKDWSIELVRLGSGSWMRSFDPANPHSESYARICSSGIALVVTPRFLGDDLVRNSQWIKSRQELFRTMVANVRCESDP